MLAAQDAVEMAGEVAVAKEVVAEVTVQPWCLGRHQRLVPARIWRGTFFPSAQGIRARMGDILCIYWYQKRR